MIGRGLCLQQKERITDLMMIVLSTGKRSQSVARYEEVFCSRCGRAERERFAESASPDLLMPLQQSGLLDHFALHQAACPAAFQSGAAIYLAAIRIITINNPVDAFTVGGIARDAGLTVKDFRKLF